MTPQERQLYAALVSDLATLLPACETWEDHLWAHAQHRLEGRLETRWRELGGFWLSLEGEDLEVDEDGRGGLQEIFSNMAQVKKEHVL